MRWIRGELRDVGEVDVVVGASGRSHYVLHALCLTVVVLMTVRMFVEMLVYQNQGNVQNAGWHRPKEREAERIMCQQDGSQLCAKLVNALDVQTVWIQPDMRVFCRGCSGMKHDGMQS